MAYQGYARGLGIDEVFTINKFAIEEYMPDLTILFDVDPQIGLDRIAKNSSREVNRLDLEKLDFHYKVREGYEIVYQNNKDKIIKINAEKSLEEVFEEVKTLILDSIKY